MAETASHFCARSIGNHPGEPGNIDQCESRVASFVDQVMVLHKDTIRCRWCSRPTCMTWGTANSVDRVYIHADGSFTTEML